MAELKSANEGRGQTRFRALPLRILLLETNTGNKKATPMGRLSRVKPMTKS
jgi:hypothetical protein